MVTSGKEGKTIRSEAREVKNNSVNRLANKKQWSKLQCYLFVEQMKEQQSITLTHSTTSPLIVINVLVTEILCEAVWFSVDPYMRQVALEFISIHI
jgi:hypothetical protein